MIPIVNDEVKAALSLSEVPDNVGNLGLEKFAVTMADELLKTTKQYDSWKFIRQKDPIKAAKISHLVLERHSYVAGKSRLDEIGRRHFDELTKRIAEEGIYLYKSDQFKSPIFSYSGSDKNQEDVLPGGFSESPSHNIKNSEASARISELEVQFAKKDCYEFLAAMLENNGIKYYGPGGVASTLVQRAKGLGKNPYALFSGEGVTELLCSRPVNITIDKVSKNSLEDIWNKLEPHLKEGAILSYSSDQFGHTGLVGKENGNWVYVNSSGKRGDKSSYRILREDLKSEIEGWLKRATRKRTFLEITLGNVDKNIAQNFSENKVASRLSYGSEINLLA